MARSVVRGGKHYGEHNMIHPVRDWLCGFVFFLAVCMVGAWWAATLYLKYEQVSVFEDASETAEDTNYRAGVVEAALAIVTARRVEYDTILARIEGVNAVTEPVLPGIATSTPEVVATSTPTTSPAVLPVDNTIETLPGSVLEPTTSSSAPEVPQLVQ